MDQILNIIGINTPILVKPINSNIKIERDIVLNISKGVDKNDINLVTRIVEKIINIHLMLTRIKTDFIKSIMTMSSNGTLVNKNGFNNGKIYYHENKERDQLAKRYFISVNFEDFICPDNDEITTCNAFPFYMSSGINSGRQLAWMPYKFFGINIEKNVDFPFFLKNPLVDDNDQILNTLVYDTNVYINEQGIKLKPMKALVTDILHKDTKASEVLKYIHETENKTMTLAPYRFQYSFEFMFASFILGGPYWLSQSSKGDRELLDAILKCLGENITTKDLEIFQINFDAESYSKKKFDLFEFEINNDIKIQKTGNIPRSSYFPEKI